MSNSSEARRLVSKWIIHIRKGSPFFGVLALYARFQPSTEIPTMATDGVRILFNPEGIKDWTLAEQIGVVIHEILHMALLHVQRRKLRDPETWNIAADIVINGQVLSAGYILPQGCVIDTKLQDLTVEEIYGILYKQKGGKKPPKGKGPINEDLLDEGHSEDGEGATDGEQYWKDALEQAAVAERHEKGSLSSALKRMVEDARPQIDWKAHLWRYLVRTPCDFSGFDRRMIGRGLYIEAMEGESVHVHICVDTSGSIGGRELATFLAEVRGILGAYPMLQGRLYYADSALYGPYDINRDSTIPPPQGGGGTDFQPFFKALEQNSDGWETHIAIYLTDGYGDFPESASVPTLWVVQAGGIPSEQFPFGEVARLV